MIRRSFSLVGAACVHAEFSDPDLALFAERYARPFIPSCNRHAHRDGWYMRVVCDWRDPGEVVAPWEEAEIVDPDRPFPPARLAVDRPGRRIQLGVARDSPEAPYVPARVVRSLLVAEARATEILLHGSAVARAGVCVALVGPKRAGKTTLWMRLATEHGASFVSNDELLLDPRSYRVRGLPTSVTLRATTLRRLGRELATDYYLKPREEGSIRIRVRELCDQLGIGITPSARVAALVCVECSDGPFRLARARPVRALELLRRQVRGRDRYQPLWSDSVAHATLEAAPGAVFEMRYRPKDEDRAVAELAALLESGA